MIQGVKAIVTRLSSSDECGIYRQADSGQLFCLFTCDSKEEAIKLGESLSCLLDRPFVNLLFEERSEKKAKLFTSVVHRKK